MRLEIFVERGAVFHIIVNRLFTFVAFVPLGLFKISAADHFVDVGFKPRRKSIGDFFDDDKVHFVDEHKITTRYLVPYGNLKIPAGRLIALDRFEQRLEIADAETAPTLALDHF